MKVRNTKRKKILISILLLITVLIVAMIIIAVTMKPENLTITDVNPALIGNGTYTGSADNGLVKATVSVTVKDGIIQKIAILEHDTLLGKPAEKIVDDVIEKQSLQVDAVTSATYSSKTILKALSNALIHQSKE